MNKLLLLLSLVVGTAGADNLISIEQIGTGNSNTVSVTVDGSDNEVDYSFGGASNSVSIDQKGDDAYIGYTTAWGSGAAWGGETPSPIQTVYSLLDAWALQVGCLGIGHLEASMIC